MQWDQLNTLIPKRWWLLLRYYLPFFKKPKPFYFTLRQFIDEKINNKEAKVGSLSLFTEFLTIIHDDLISDVFREKLILCVLPKEDKKDKEGKEGKEEKLPPDIFEIYLSHFYNDIAVERLSGSLDFRDYKNQIACCVKLKDKFKMEDRLRILTLLSDKVIDENREFVSAFTMHKIEEVLPCIELLKPELQKKVLKFYLSELDKNHPLYVEFLTTYFTLDPQKAFSTLTLSRKERLQWRAVVLKKIKDNFATYLKCLSDFFTDHLQTACSMLNLSNTEQWTIINKMYDEVPKEEKERWLMLWFSDHRKIVLKPSFINHLITCVFRDKSEVASLILKRILNSSDRDALSAFHLLAIQSLLNIPYIPREPVCLENFLLRDVPALNLNKRELPDKLELSAEIQNFVIEYGIASLDSMVQSIINALPKHPEQNSLHSDWSGFTNNRWVDPSVSQSEQWNVIAKKIIKDYDPQGTNKKILSAYGNLYSLLDPKEARLKEIAEYRANDQPAQADNSAVVKREHRHESIKMIRSGMLTSVSEEYMKELYEADAEEKMEHFKQKEGTTFFRVKDKKSNMKALSEAQSIISLRKL